MDKKYYVAYQFSGEKTYLVDTNVAMSLEEAQAVAQLYQRKEPTYKFFLLQVVE